MKAIETRADLRALVDEFYRRLLADERIAPVFERLDLDVHLPVLVDFWSMVLLGESSYRRNAFEQHLSVAIEDRHFDVWLGHWDATIDALFVGDKAGQAKARARSVASIFRSKLRALGRLG